MSGSEIAQARANNSVTTLGHMASVLVAAQAGLWLLALFFPGALERFLSTILHDELKLLWLSLALLVCLFFAAVVSFLLWMRRAAWNLRLLHPEEGFVYTPGWCVGWWFVPFANLVHPFKAMHEIWHYSDPDAERVDTVTGYAARSDWGKGAPLLLSSWWAAWIASWVLSRIIRNADSLLEVWITLGGIVDLSAGVLCLLVIRKVTGMQRESFARRRRGPGVASSFGHVVGRAGEEEGR